MTRAEEPRLSRLVLGTATFGVTPTSCAVDALVRRAWDLGITTIDTASSYGNQSRFDRPGVPAARDRKSAEELVGRAVRGRRDNFVICTKVGERTDPGADGAGLGRRHVRASVVRSLRRLGTDRVEVLYAHHPDPERDVDEVLETFAELIRESLVRHYGISTFSAAQTTQVERADVLGVPRPVVHQLRHHVGSRGPGQQALQRCRDLSLPVAAFGALGGGLLTEAAGRRRHSGAARWGGSASTGDELAFADGFVALARDSGWDPAVLALAWVLGLDGVSCAVLGPESVAELDALAPAASARLDDELRHRVDALTMR